MRQVIKHRDIRLLNMIRRTDPEIPRDIIKRLDAGRETYIKKYENTSRYDTRNYDLVLSMDGKTEDEIVDVILKYIG